MKFIADPDMIGFQPGLNALFTLRSSPSQGLISLEKRGELLLHSHLILTLFEELFTAKTEIGFGDGILQQVALLSKRGSRERQNNDGEKESHSHRRILTSFGINAKLNMCLKLLSDKQAFS